MSRPKKKQRISMNGDQLSSSDDDYYYSSDSSGDDYESIREIIPQHREEEKSSNYRILSSSDIIQSMEDDITRLSSVLSLSRDHTFILLRHYNWRRTGDVSLAWFDNEDTLRKNLGLLETRPPLVDACDSINIQCKICFELNKEEFDSASCGHMFCTECWMNYIKMSIGEGAVCLGLRCPEPTCSVVVNRAMVNRLAPNEAKDKYERFLIRSYVQGNPDLKWCPSPGCNFAVERCFSHECTGYDILCHCSNHFCWRCTKEAHSPVDCDTASKWMLKTSSSETLSADWILRNTKPCPNCKTPIENKTNTEGCNRVTCGCGFQFYVERWFSYDNSINNALSELREVQTVKIKELAEKNVELAYEFRDFRGVVEAWKQIVECTRVLKWSYAYGYNIRREEECKKAFFEYLQGEAEYWLEKLHECAHQELIELVAAPIGIHQFMQKLTALTHATRGYFNKLVKHLENGSSFLLS